tara:strand:- start:114 stop:425 length:312 start_codon:yes stop_codon:yes gene_type:complete
MLSPSDGTVRNVSMLFGGLEITDAIGHVILIGVDCALLYGVIQHYQPSRQALKFAIFFTLLLGIALESAQLWIPSRGSSWIDFVAAGVGVGLAYLVISRLESK